MKKRTHFLLLLICISFLSCNKAPKNQATPISDIDTDFPVTEKLEFKPFNKYDILEIGFCMIDDSTLWFVNEGKYDFGSCYNLNTGEKLSIVASKGRAAYELTYLDAFNMVGDSVQFHTNRNMIKTFAKQDIINNVPISDRKFSVITAPDSIKVYRMVKLPNGSVLTTLQPALYGFEKENTNEFNQKTVAIFNNKEANSYEIINYESFDIKKAEGSELPANELIKCAYTDGDIVVKDNDMAIFSVSHQFIIYTFDINTGNIVNEKRYTKMQREKSRDTSSMSTTMTTVTTMNDKQIDIHSIKTNNKYILCSVEGYFSKDDKDSKLCKEAIFVFDCQLNPIRKFDLPNRENGYYTISNDCKSVYFCEFNEEGLTLHKADLNI